MSAAVLLLLSIVVVSVAYFTYGSFVVGRLGLDAGRRTPAHAMEDGIDFVPSSKPVVLGHHFASIAGAGPIVGPIIAISFGWLPAFLWILIGVVFIGAVHDVTTLTASIRHGGRTISDIVEDYVGVPAKRLFVLFAFAALILVIAVFTQLVAVAFERSPAVASTSALFMVLAVAFGFATHRLRVPIVPATLVGIAGLAGCVALGPMMPLEFSKDVWIGVIMVYISIAAVSPVWALLQPRDYLNSFLLYGMLGAGILGVFVARPTMTIEAFTGWNHAELGFMFPILFVTVACGAISGFHSLVASGTTSKQIDVETDAKFIGYGGMLIEGVLAVLALIAAGVMSTTAHAEAVSSAAAIGIFANGVGSFMAALGIEQAAATRFVALAVAAFALTSLDTCTRLARLLFGEFFTTKAERESLKRRRLVENRFVSTGIVVALGAALTLSGTVMTAWPVFGAANQLLAALALLSVATWLSHKGIRNEFVVVPMVFMFGVTFVALAQLLLRNYGQGNWVMTVLSALLLALSLVLAVQAASSVRRRRPAAV